MKNWHRILRCWTLKLKTDYEYWYTNWYWRLNGIFGDFFQTFLHTRIWNLVKMFNGCWNCWLEIAGKFGTLSKCSTVVEIVDWKSLDYFWKIWNFVKMFNGCWNCWLEITWILLEITRLFWRIWTFVDWKSVDYFRKFELLSTGNHLIILENLNFCRLEITWLIWRIWTFVD